LLGNIGRPGGGVVALRGHANVQGATDLELLYHELPGYLAMPLRDAHPDLKTYLEKETPKGGYWVNKPKFMISLLKAFYGDAATKDNEFGYQWLPKRASADAYSHQHIFVDMYAGKIKGFLADGQNPAVGGPNAKLARSAMDKLDWLVVKDIFLTETADFWKAPGVNPKDIKTEVFFLPAAPAAEKDGSLTNTMRLIQWHERAVNPPGDVTSDAEFFTSLAKRLQKMYAGSKKERDKGFLAADFTYGDGKEPDMQLVLKEINGYATEEIKDKDGKVTYKKGQPLNTFGHMTDDGRTAGGCWIYTGVIVEGPDGKLVNKANSHKPADEKDPLGHGWGFAWPANRRILYNRASTDLQGKPWSDKKKLIWWDPEAPGAEPDKKGKWVGRDVPDFNPVLAPNDKNGDKPFIMRGDLVGGFFGPLNDGPFPEHYEAVEAAIDNPLHPKVTSNPTSKRFATDKDTYGKKEDFPIVCTTYRLTEHFHYWTQHQHNGRLNEMQPGFFVEIPEGLAKEKGIANGSQVKVTSARGSIQGVAMVTKRMPELKIDGKPAWQIGFPIHWGYAGDSNHTGPLANMLTPSAQDPNTWTPEYKAFLVKVEKA